MKKLILLLLTMCVVLCLVGCDNTKEVVDMDYSIVFGDKTLPGSYTGTITNKVPNGEGILRCLVEDCEIVYSGCWEAGEFTGEIDAEHFPFTLEWEGKEYSGIYSGTVKNALPDGTGIFDYEDGIDFIKYSGGWACGKMSGNGELETNLYAVHFTDGVNRVGEYIGETFDGLAEGKGIINLENDDKIKYSYEGQWKNGLFDGYGTVVFDNENDPKDVGTFINGEFQPTPFEYFYSEGTRACEPYNITSNAKNFLTTYPDIFTINSTDGYEIEFENNFQYNQYAKNPFKYGEKLIKVRLSVVQIREGNYWGADHTYLIGEDSARNVYTVNMYGFLENVVKGSSVNLTALPLAYYTYPNVAGVKIWAIACAGVSIA